MIEGLTGWVVLAINRQDATERTNTIIIISHKRSIVIAKGHPYVLFDDLQFEESRRVQLFEEPFNFFIQGIFSRIQRFVCHRHEAIITIA